MKKSILVQLSIIFLLTDKLLVVISKSNTQYILICLFFPPVCKRSSRQV